MATGVSGGDDFPLAPSFDKKDHAAVQQNEIGVRPRKWWQFGGKDRSFVPVDSGSSSPYYSSSNDVETPNSSLEHSVFDDVDASEIYKPIEKYEGRHRFDPKATWSPEEERRLVRVLDLRICLAACIMFFALQLDRGNISQALSDNMLDDLGLSTNDYNNGMSIFYCSFLFAEMPSQFIGKKLGPDNWIPTQMVSWSLVAALQCKITGRTSFFICRFLLGLLEGGFIPDLVLYLSYFYKNRELPVRLSFFWTAYVTTNIIAAFLAYGILHMRGSGPLQEGWRYLFAIEGAITGTIGILSWFYLPPSPTQTKRHGWKGLLRPKSGWFTEREEIIMVTRVLRDDPGKATMHNRQALSFGKIWESLSDFDLWPIYLIGLTWTVPMTPVSNYLTLTLKSIGFNTFQTNLLTIPSSVLFICQLLFWTWLSEKINQRLLMGLIAQLWALPLVIALECLPVHFAGAQWVRYTLTSLVVGYPYAHAVLVALTSRNSGTVRSRTVGSSLYNMAVQASNIISTQIYQTPDKPYYYTGNKVLIAICAYNIVLIIGSKLYYVRKNAKRDQIWGSMTREERLQYLATTTDKGNKRLDFRFAS